MKLCLLNWVEAGGEAHNGAPVKMNENKGIRGTACCSDLRATRPQEKSPQCRHSCAAGLITF